MKQSLELIASVKVLLEGHKARFNNNFRPLFESGGTRVVEEEKVLRIVIKTYSASEKSLIDSNTIIKEGVSDFDKNRLEDEEVFVIRGFRVGYDNNANTGQEGLLKYLTAAPASVRNARLFINQGSAELGKYPLSALLNPHTGASNKDDFKELKTPIVIVGGKAFDYKIQYPLGATPHATNVEYLELVSVGYKVVRSSNKQ